MKTRISFLKAILVLSVSALVIFSCTKEELLTVEPDHQKLETNTQEAAYPLLGKTLDEALASLEFADHPRWGVAIKIFRCRQQGTTLVVHNPNEPNLRYYDSERFKVYWFKDGQPLRDHSIKLDCVCNGKYAAIVMHTTAQKAIGIADYKVRACFVIENSVIDND